ncbi:glycosyltransferase family 4 protein [Streptomyces pathocidini]|uniref:Glycosyltransferase family 4 protein n=1 Tax=Streptomyces pathocidini TaxID=1650571 RepID=A0ABW7URU3_9ACTN|nr:glycosyltransferase family 4 protein [Streptomyces pathocidini]
MTAVRPVVLLGEGGPLRTELERAGVEVEVCRVPDGLRGCTMSSPVAQALGSAGTVPRYLRELCRRIDAHHADVVYTHSAKAHLYGALAARLARVPHVLHAHDLMSAPPASRFGSLLLRSAARSARAVIANSGTTLATVPNGRRRTVIPCPVSDELFTATPFTACTDSSSGTTRAGRQAPLSLGVAGRLAPWKGQHLALAAFARIAPDLPPGSRLQVAGAALFDTDRPYATELTALARELGVADQVVFLGHVRNLPRHMASWDLTLHTSISPEPFGQVIVESMAVGTPVIAPAAGGPAEIITSGTDGLLYPTGDVEGLVGALQQLVHDAPLRQMLAHAARRTASRYASGPIVAGIENVLVRAAGPVRRT